MTKTRPSGQDGWAESERQAVIEWRGWNYPELIKARNQNPKSQRKTVSKCLKSLSNYPPCV